MENLCYLCMGVGAAVGLANIYCRLWGDYVGEILIGII